MIQPLEIIAVDQNSDLDLIFHINNFDSLLNYALKMEIRAEETDVLMGAFTVIATSPTSFRASLSHTVTATIPEGDYLTDVLAIGARYTYITPPMILRVNKRITRPS